MGPLIEKGRGFIGLKEEWKVSSRSVFTALTAMVFVVSGAIPMLASVASGSGMTSKQAVSFVMCSMMAGALISIFASLYYRTPFYFAASLTAIVVLTPMFERFSPAQMVGGFIIAGLAVFIIGYTGIMGWIGKHLPLPIVLGMVAGVFMGYGLDIISSITDDTVSGCIIAGSFVAFPLITKKIPPHIVALAAGIACTAFIHKTGLGVGEVNAVIAVPQVTMPDFSGNVVLTVSLPLVIMALADVLKGYGVLKAEGYHMPLNTITALSGLSSIIAAFGLGHTISLAGPVIAILSGSEAGKKEGRFVGAVIYCCGVIAICVAAALIIPLVAELPETILNLICGLAMTGLLTSSLKGAFGKGSFQMGALTAFLTGLSKLSLFGIGAPVWAVVFGLTVSVCMERENFRIG